MCSFSTVEGSDAGERKRINFSRLMKNVKIWIWFIFKMSTRAFQWFRRQPQQYIKKVNLWREIFHRTFEKLDSDLPTCTYKTVLERALENTDTYCWFGLAQALWGSAKQFSVAIVSLPRSQLPSDRPRARWNQTLLQIRSRYEQRRQQWCIGCHSTTDRALVSGNSQERSQSVIPVSFVRETTPDGC